MRRKPHRTKTLGPIGKGQSIPKGKPLIYKPKAHNSTSHHLQQLNEADNEEDDNIYTTNNDMNDHVEALEMATEYDESMYQNDELKIATATVTGLSNSSHSRNSMNYNNNKPLVKMAGCLNAGKNILIL